MNRYLMIFFLWITRQQGGDNVTTTNIRLQASKNTMNSPIKSCGSIFTEATMNIIVNYTNDYVSFNEKEWGGILKIDLVYCLSAILISPIIKCNDHTSKWFSDDPIIIHYVIKRIMSGSKFLRVVGYLHVCGMKKKVSTENPEYDPLFKLSEFQKNMDRLFNHLFVPGCCLIMY